MLCFREQVREQEMKNRKKENVLASALAVWLLVAGCSSGKSKPTPENFQEGLNAYYATHNDCLFSSTVHFPYEVSPGPDAATDRKRMEALLHSALLKREEEQGIHVSVYSLTPAGERTGSRFCYGHRQVTCIDSFTPPVKATNGLLQTQVTYHYTMTEVPVWAKTQEMQSAFPDLAKALSGEATAQATLASAGVGWQIPQ
jgi:hypothetical protein